MPTSRPSSPSAFAALGLSETLVAAVAALGYEEPTPVQRETVPRLLSGRDMLAQADTGTGKTAAFALPMLHRLIDSPTAGRHRTRGLVLVPTRELAMQVAEAIHKYARGTRLAVAPIYGGASMTQQVRALERGADVVVATPGRALDHVRRQTLDLGHVSVLVLDEADEMLDMGFAEDLEALIEATPTERQTALFSATIPPRILSIAQKHLVDPERVTIAREATPPGTPARVRQVAYVVSRAHKPAALQRVLDSESPSSALVFCRTRLEVDTLVETLNAHGYRAEALHGGLQQRQRDAVMARFRTARTDLLVATDVAARGLDIEQLSHVVNYDLPSDVDAYVHRIGRTGRAGREGSAVTLLEPREHRLLKVIERATGRPIQVCPVPTVADLRARRLELTRASLRERLLAGDLGDVRVVVESLAAEFDVVDVAAAAVQLAHASLGGDAGEVPDIPQPALPQHGGPNARGGGKGRDAVAGAVRVFVGAGREAGVRPADLVGAITGEAGLQARDLGSIEIADRFSLVEVPEARARDVIAALRQTTLRGRRVTVRLDREPASRGGSLERPSRPRPDHTRSGRGRFKGA